MSKKIERRLYKKAPSKAAYLDVTSLPSRVRIVSLKMEVRLLKRSNKRKGEQLERDACVICLEKCRNVVLMPCRHLCMCKACNANLRKRECPICRAKIDNAIEVFT